MKPGFFSFVAIALVALVLFMAASYLFAFKDFRDSAKNDLEVRRVGERIVDVRDALNLTLLDASYDAAYESYGCDQIPVNESAPGTCGNISKRIDWYLANTSKALSDEILVNITQTYFSCIDDPSRIGMDMEDPPIGFFIVNSSRTISASFDVLIISRNSKLTENVNYNYSVDMVNWDYCGPIFGIPCFVYSSAVFGVEKNSNPRPFFMAFVCS